MAFKRKKNLRYCFIRSKHYRDDNTVETPGTTSCHRPRCNTCSHVSLGNTIRGPLRNWNVLGSYACISQEIKRRITLGWQAFGRASAIFKNKEIPTCLKRQVYNQCIIPTVTYGSETWNLTKIQTMKLRSMQRAHESIMLNITWRDQKTADWIREQTKLRDILETISKAKWTWAGHLTRRTDNRWTTKLTFWQPRGHTRNKGRPKFRWRDDLDKFRKHWHRDASDRLRWRQMGKAYVQLRTFKG